MALETKTIKAAATGLATAGAVALNGWPNIAALKGRLQVIELAIKHRWQQNNELIYPGDFEGAASGMLNSLWAKQTPDCAMGHADMMCIGNYDTKKQP